MTCAEDVACDEDASPPPFFFGAVCEQGGEPHVRVVRFVLKKSNVLKYYEYRIYERKHFYA